MESFLALDNSSRELKLHAKKRLEHRSDVVFKVRGSLNTVTTQSQVDGCLMKFFRFGSEPRFADDDIYKPDQRLRLGIGAKASSTSDDTLLTIAAKKKVRLAKSTDSIRGRQILNSYTQAKLSAHYDYNVRTEAWSGEAVAAVSHALFKWSDDMDVRVTAGCSVPLSATGAGDPQPFLKVQENNWQLVVDTKGGWRVMYGL